MENTMRLGKVWGIPIGIHSSWYLIFAFLTWSLASNTLPVSAPGYSAAIYWLMAGITSVMFFASVVAHELGHSILALRNGIPVEKTSLFVFGGVAQIKEEPHSPGVEFRIAIAGPLVSLLLAGVFGLIYWIDLEYPMLAAPTGYLAQVNLMLALFNLIPAFPLDGGRIFRSVVWKLTGSIARATRLASAGGQLFGFGFMGLGLFMSLTGNLGNGLYFLFIGWFLRSIASSANQQMELRQTLEGVKAGQVAGGVMPSISPLSTLYQLVHQYILVGSYRRFLVVENGPTIGVVSFKDIQKVPQSKWRFRTASQLMVPLVRLTEVDSELPIMDTIKLLQQAPNGLLSVKDGEGQIRLISTDDVTNYMNMRRQLGL